MKITKIYCNYKGNKSDTVTNLKQYGRILPKHFYNIGRRNTDALLLPNVKRQKQEILSRNCNPPSDEFVFFALSIPTLN